MRLYAQRPDLRLRQLTADASMVAWLVGWVLLARTVHRAVLVLAEPGVELEDLGRSMASSMASAARSADWVRVAGAAVAKPFGPLSAASASVSGAGQAAQDAVRTLAAVLAV